MKKRIIKRKQKRFKISIPIEFYIPLEHTKRKVKIRAVTKDVSRTGFSFVSSCAVTKQRTVRFILKVPDFTTDKDKVFSLKGTVKWNNPVKPSVIRQTGVCLLKGRNLVIMKQIFEHLKTLYSDRSKFNKKLGALFKNIKGG